MKSAWFIAISTMVLASCEEQPPTPEWIGGTSREENCGIAWSAMTETQRSGERQDAFDAACVADEFVMQCNDGLVVHTSGDGPYCTQNGGVRRHLGIFDG